MTNTPKPLCVGDVFSRMKFTTEEEQRLAATMAKGGVAAHVIKKYVIQTEPYKSGFRKQHKISGFRNSTAAYDQAAITVIVRALRDSRHSQHRFCWDHLYRDSATAFIHNELPRLGRLLAEVDAPSGSDDPAENLRAVCANALDFEVSQDDVRKFYEVWGMPRVGHFDDLLRLCLQRDEASAQKRTLAKLVSDVASLMTTVTENSARATLAAEAIAADRQLAAQDRKHLRASEEALDGLSKKLSELFERTASDSESRDTSLYRLAPLTERLKRGERATNELRDELHKSASQTKSLIASAIGALATELKDSWASDLSAATGGLEAKIVVAAKEGAIATSEARTASIVRSLDWTPADRVISDSVDLRTALMTAFRGCGVAPPAAIRIHAAVAAGLLPIVVGPAALLALDVYSRVVCGGRAVTLHVSPAIFEPTELFGRVDTTRGAFVCHAAGLLDILNAAAGSRGVGLVSLEGINRGPTESYLLPLLQMRSRGGRIPLFHSGAPISSPVRVDPILVWPSNLWLAATSVDGPTSLPISRELLAHAVVIEADECPPTPGGAERPPSEIALDGNVVTPGEIPAGVVDGLVELLPDARGYRSSLKRFGAMLARFQSDPRWLRTALVESVLLPVAVTLESEEERGEALATLGKHLDADAEETGRLVALGRRVRRRIA
jgi:hypothetical protein